MNIDPQHKIELSDVNDFIDILHFPTALVQIPDAENDISLIHFNSAYQRQFKKWLKEPVPLPISFISSISSFARGINKKNKTLYSYIEELNHLFRLDLSYFTENKYILIVSESTGNCLLNKNYLKEGGGCSCVLNRFTEGRIIVDSKCLILAFNDVAESFTKKYINQNLKVGESFCGIVPEDESKTTTLNIAKALSGEYFYVDLSKKFNNTRKVLRYKYSPVFDSSEKPFAVLIVFEDITSEVQTENEKTKTNDFYKQTLDILGDGYWIWTASTDELFVSKQVYNQLGYNPKEISPSISFFSSLLHLNDKQKILNKLIDLTSGKRNRFESEFRIKNSSGEFLWFLARAAAFGRNENGSAKQIVGITIDISHKRKMQDELYRSEERLRKAQEIAHIGSWEEHFDKNNNFWSNETYNILGLTPDVDIPSLSSLLPYIDQDKKELLENLIWLISSQGNEPKQKLPFKYKCPSGDEKYLLINAEPVIGSDKKVMFWQGVVQDISWQRNYERFLKEGKENLMALVTNMPALVFATDKGGNLVFWNRKCEEITGFKSKEIVGNKDAFKLLYPDVELRKKIRTQIKDMGMSLSTWEHKITTKKGEQRDIVWSAFSEYVKVEGWNAVAIGYDITYQKNNERFQAAYRRKLEALAETATDFVGMPMDESLFHHLGTQFEKHVPGHIFIIKSYDPNDGFFTVEGVYGLKTKEWEQVLNSMGWNPVGRRFNVTPDMHKVFSKAKLISFDSNLYEFTEGLVSSLASRNIEKNLEIDKIFTIGLIKDKNLLGGITILTRGETPDIDFSIVEGLVNQAAVAIDRRQLEQQLVVAKEKAEEADKLKSAFLANMSHEIRTPMNAILGFSQLLNLPNLTKEKRKMYIDIINAKGSMLVKLINDIIDASKVEAGQLTLVKTSCRLNDLLRNTKIFWDKEKIFLNRESIEIRLSLPNKTDDIEIITDEGRLEQIFTNLLGNAVKFTEKGHVEFGYNIEETTLIFFVKDTGIGIDSSQHQNIFDRFRQVDDGSTRTLGGTGLGLSISKGIVDLMGGKIWVESSLGMGAEFYFTLPFTESVDHSAIPISVEQDEEEKLPDWKNRVLLVAEDEEVNYIYLNEILVPTGVNVLWAKDGLQAVELVKNIKKIDAILMDIKMPVMNGYAATMEIRQINPDIPIIAQTAYAFSEDRQKAEAAGCDDYITKPINSKELFQIIDKYLG